MLFCLFAALVLLLSVLLGAIARDSAFEIAIHDTYFVAPYHIATAPVVIAALTVALVYFAFDRMLHRRLNLRLGLIHFALSVLAVFLVAKSFYPTIALTGASQRRYYSYSLIELSEGVISLFTIAGVLLILGQLIFVFNIGRTLSQRRPSA